MRLSSSVNRKRFVVSIFLVDQLVEFPLTDRLSIPLTRLYRGSLYGEDSRWAAARAWIRHVGQYREKRLEDLKAPRGIVMAQVDVSSVANRLVETSLCPVHSGFMLDNGVEAWLISVHLATRH